MQIYFFIFLILIYLYKYRHFTIYEAATHQDIGHIWQSDQKVATALYYITPIKDRNDFRRSQTNDAMKDSIFVLGSEDSTYYELKTKNDPFIEDDVYKLDGRDSIRTHSVLKFKDADAKNACMVVHTMICLTCFADETEFCENPELVEDQKEKELHDLQEKEINDSSVDAAGSNPELIASLMKHGLILFTPGIENTADIPNALPSPAPMPPSGFINPTMNDNEKANFRI